MKTQTKIVNSACLAAGQKASGKVDLYWPLENEQDLKCKWAEDFSGGPVVKIACFQCRGFPGSSASKESTYKSGDSGVIPGLERSPGEGISYPLQFSWASLVAQFIKNLPAVWETWVQSLSWEDPLEKGMATSSNILAWKIPMDRGAWQAAVYGVANSRTCKELDTTEQLSTAQQ